MTLLSKFSLAALLGALLCGPLSGMAMEGEEDPELVVVYKRRPYTLSVDTALLDALRVQKTDLAGLLVQNGAKFPEQDGYEAVLAKNPSYEALKGWKINIATLDAPDASSGMTELCRFVIQGNTAIVEMLLKAGVNRDLPETSGCQTPLHFAALRSDEKMADLLLKSGAASNPQDSGGSTPLVQAIEEENIPMVKLLKFYGVPVNSLSWARRMSLTRPESPMRALVAGMTSLQILCADKLNRSETPVQALLPEALRDEVRHTPLGFLDEKNPAT